MEPVNGSPWPFNPLDGLKKVRDLVYFDGPLLTHFEHENGDDYLFHWVDCDSDYNRWLVLRVDEASIIRLTNRFESLDSVIPKQCRDRFVILMDIDSSGVPVHVQSVDVTKIPADYLPQPGAFLSVASGVTSERDYSVVVDGEWGVEELGEFPHTFSKAYGLVYAVNVLNRPFEGFPWRGGFSSLHFYNSIARAIPPRDRPSVAAIQYASPGFMRFSLHGKTAEQVARCIYDYKRSNVALAGAFGELTGYIRENGLNEEDEHQSDETWERHSPFLVAGAEKLLSGFEVMDAKEIIAACRRPFEAAKIAMSFYRNIKKLVGFEKRKLVRFADPRPVHIAPTREGG